MAAVDKATHNARWQEMWGKGLKEGEAFDAKRSAPILQHLLDTGALDVKGRACFVPGCGRGYDCITFAKAGAGSVVGLELAPDAVKAAQAYLVEQQVPPEAAARITYAAGDFFQHGTQYDVGYDYTFLCAQLPSERANLGRQWARVIKPGGELVTLIFPIDPTKDPNQGPPFPVTPEQYKEVFEPAGFVLEHLGPVPPELSHPPRAGKEQLGRWRRRGEGAL